MVIEINPKILERFWSKVVKTETCWIWIRHKNRDGYGKLRANNLDYLAHRFAYEITNGEIPKGLQLDHLCRNRYCVNPDHMEVVTSKENLSRGLGINVLNSLKKYCKRGHILTLNNLRIYELSKGKRICIECVNERARIKYKEKQLKK